jgi:3,4-dihydroxyphenylacetate 2,3-dioxygenase
MGQIVAAALAAHVPPLMVPPEFRAMLSPGLDTSLIPGLHEMRAALDAAAPDCFLIFDTHWITTTEHILDAAEHHRGVFTSSELPQLMHDMPFDFPGAAALGQAAEAIGQGQGVRILAANNAHLPKHYPTLNLLHYLHKGEKVLIAGTCQTARAHNFLDFGRVLAEAIKQSDLRVAVIASGGMSHTFWPFDEIFQHGSFDPAHVISAEARAFDERLLALWEKGDHAEAIRLYPQYLAFNPEGWFGHYLSLAGALGGVNTTAKGRLMSRYENALGTGQAHVWFDLAGGQA